MFKPSKIELLRDSIDKVTSVLSGKNVKVTQRGTEAYVVRDIEGTPIEVNLPYVPENASEQLLRAVQGFVDHEVSHVLFSDPKCAFEAKSTSEKLEKIYGFFNDAHSETQMRKAFKGSNRNLTELAQFYTDKKLADRWTELGENGASEKEKLGAMMGAVTRAWSGDAFYQDFMQDKWSDLSATLDKIPESFINKVANTKSSQDALNLTKEFVTYLEHEDDGESDKGDDSENENENDSEGLGDATGEGAQGDEDSENDGDQEENDPKDDSDSAGDITNEESKKDSDALEDFMSGVDNTEKPEGAINDEIRSSLKECYGAYLVYTTDFDNVSVPDDLKDHPYREQYITEIEDKALRGVGSASKMLEKAFVSQNRIFYESNKRSGAINPSSLFKLKTGDSRVFRKKVEVRALNTAVSLVIDQSGSMCGKKMENAAIAAYALADILERIKIPFEIIGFTTNWGNHSEYDTALSEAERKLQVAHGRGFSRMERLETYIYKSFDERFQVKQRERLARAYSNQNNMAANADGESIMYCAKRLARHTAPRKCMIVLSDGQPACRGIDNHLHSHLIKTIKDIEKSGIDIVGLGVLTSVVKNYYSKWLHFNDPENIASEVIGQLSRILVK